MKIINTPTVVLAFTIAFQTVLFAQSNPASRPNILFIMGEDASAADFGIYGGQAMTPVFDALAKDGILFTHAFAASPQCSPTKFSMLTGKMPWQAGSPVVDHRIRFASSFVTYPDALEKAGYIIGKNGKGGWKRTYNKNPGPRGRNPAGEHFSSFDAFLERTPKKQPFCFWGTGITGTAHRPFKSKGNSIPKDRITLPPYFHDSVEIRSDIKGYLKAVNAFDADMDRYLKILKKHGRYDNTMIIAMPGDHGWPFPRGKCNLYDTGTRIPLAIYWKGKIGPGRVCGDLVSACDVYATVIDAAGLPIPEGVAGKSLLPLILSERNSAESPREAVVMARGYHEVYYPSRAVRTKTHLYIRNYRPELFPQGFHFNDGVGADAPIRRYILRHREKAEVQPCFALSFGRRPAEELYELASDPWQTNNLATMEEHQPAKERLSSVLAAFQEQFADPILEHHGIVSEDIVNSHRMQE